jgi:hypothetical protein
MARTPDSKRVKEWKTRVDLADKVYTEWEDKFRCDDLEQYYEGFQWSDEGDHYTINLFFPTVEVRLPSLMFRRPKANFTLVPYREDDANSGLEARAELLESVADHFVTRQGTDFRPETLLATKESLYRFGVIESAYSANFTDNPKAGRPALNEEGEPLKHPETGDDILERDRILEDERIYVRRVPARQFRVPANNKNRLDHNDWCGYYEYHWPSDLKKNKQYKNTHKLKGKTYMPEHIDPGQHVQKGDEQYKEGMTKIWKIWDLRIRKRYVFPEDGDFFLVDGDKFDYHPFSILKFHERMDTFYPVPYLFNLISPQDELNETREMQKTHRRRFCRRYMMRENAIDDDELAKLTGPPIDGQVVVVKAALNDVFAPIPDAPLDRAVAYNVPTTHDDFSRISAIGGEARGLSDADTATQAQIINQNSNVRDQFTRDHVASWLSDVIRTLVKSARDNLSGDFYVKVNVDPFSPQAQEEAQGVIAVWQTIKPEMIGEIEFEVTIDVETLAPPNKELDKREWLEAMSVIFGNPASTMILANSPLLTKRTLDLYNITNGKDIVEIHKAIQGVAMHLMQAAGGDPNNANAAGTAGGGDQAPGSSQVNNKMLGGMNTPK